MLIIKLNLFLEVIGWSTWHCLGYYIRVSNFSMQMMLGLITSCSAQQRDLASRHSAKRHQHNHQKFHLYSEKYVWVHNSFIFSSNVIDKT